VKNKVLSMITGIVMLISGLNINIYAEAIYSGTCGENLVWELDDEGTLTISGTGEMDDYGYVYDDWEISDYRMVPWEYMASDIVEVVIEDGVTTIGDYAFHGCINKKK